MNLNTEPKIHHFAQIAKVMDFLGYMDSLSMMAIVLQTFLWRSIQDDVNHAHDVRYIDNLVAVHVGFCLVEHGGS